MDSLRGSLMIASPALLDPNFLRSVVLIVEHNDDGALGVVLTRPSETTVAEAVEELAHFVDPEEPVHVGGPVNTSSVVILAEFDPRPDPERLLVGDVGVVTTADQLDQPETWAARLRVFAGYAGWGPGQLEAELEREDWIVAPADPEDVFCPVPARLWSTALERLGGRYLLLARMPLDLSWN